MPSILNLKFKGNKSFVAFSNLNDTEALTKTWKICTKVAGYLEQGQRLENLSWRLWHLQSLIVDSDNAKSKREFKKLSKYMGDKLDKEKGRSIEELEAPDFKHNHSTDMIRQRAAEKERNREASQNAMPGTIKRMQFTFSIDPPTPFVSTPVRKPDPKPSPDFTNSSRSAGRVPTSEETMVTADNEANDKDPPLTQRGRRQSFESMPVDQIPHVHLPSLFFDGFGPSALLNSSPTLTTRMNYGEGVGLDSNDSHEGFGIARPTIELPIDELLGHVDPIDNSESWSSPYSSSNSGPRNRDDQDLQQPSHGFNSQFLSRKRPAPSTSHESDDDSTNDSYDEDSDAETSANTLNNFPPISQAVKEVLSPSISPSNVNPNSVYNTRAQTPTGRPNLTVRTQITPNTRSSGPGATVTSLDPVDHTDANANTNTNTNNNFSTGNSAPGGVKAECSNCGATHTPLWRRGLNDELNCNACGLYCKLHKRPRPKSMRNTHGEGRTQAAPRPEAVDVLAMCFNCHTTATPLWRKDDEGKTVCNACGLYYKLHGSPRPISMKSDVIRKRSRHDTRRNSSGISSGTPSVSPGVSRRPSPIREASPILAPDSTTQVTYDYEDTDFRSSQSELMGALGHDPNQYHMYSPSGPFNFQYPGPYHPDHLLRFMSPPADALPFASVDSSDIESISMSPRTHKRRRMSTDSISEPPSSAVSFGSYNDGYSTCTSATSHSQRSSMEFPFSNYPVPYNNGPVFRASCNAFRHPPMMPQNDSPHNFHPPMLPPAEESPMDYLHPPMLPQEDDCFWNNFVHPPMSLPDDSAMNGLSQPHPPMFPHEYQGPDSYDATMRVY